MQPPPKNWPRLSSALFYDDAGAAIDWLCRAFGFSVRIKVEGEGGRIVHSELELGEGVIMVATSGKSSILVSPGSIGGKNTQCLMAYIDDVDAHCATARAAGAKILKEPANQDYGPDHWADRGYEAEDIGGHRWWFAQRLRG